MTLSLGRSNGQRTDTDSQELHKAAGMTSSVQGAVPDHKVVDAMESVVERNEGNITGSATVRIIQTGK